MKKIGDTVNLFDFDIFSKSKKELLKILNNHLEQSSELLVVFTPNPEQIMLAKRDKSFASTLGSADILIPDGAGLVAASKLLSVFSSKRSLSERISGIDLAEDIINLAADQRKKILLIGGKDYSQGRGMINFVESKLFWTPGYIDANAPTREEEASVINQIKKIQPDIVFVALGAPKQEKWVQDHYQLLSDNNVQLAMVVGGAFDMLLGKLRRAPKLIREWGFEWLFRLVQQPWRFWRQLRLISFIGLTIKTAAQVILQTKKP